MKRAGLLLLLIDHSPLEFVQVVRPENKDTEKIKKIPSKKKEDATDKEQKDKEQA